MGSKKLKRKLKNKKLGLKTLKKLKKRGLNGHGLSSDVDKCQSLDNFSQVRENYYEYLRNVIKENLKISENSNLTNETLERLSLEMEQEALLACMKAEIYQRVMTKIIHDIKKSTKHMKLHLEIKNFMLSHHIKLNEVLSRLKSEERSNKNPTPRANSPEVYSHIPTISSVTGNYNDGSECWSSQNVFNEYASHGNLVDNDFICGNNELQPVNVIDSYETQNFTNTIFKECTNNVEYFRSLDCTTNDNVLPNSPGKRMYIDRLTYHKEENTASISQNLVSLTSDLPDNEQSTKKDETEILDNCEIANIDLIPVQVDTISKSRHKLQKSVEKTLKTINEIKMQQREERDRANIAKILENDLNDVDENQYDSLSDNCDDLAAYPNACEDKTDNVLADRLEELRQLFGVDGSDNDNEEKVEKEFPSKVNTTIKYINQQQNQKHRHLWYHEKVIHMHKLSLLSSEMTQEMKERNRGVFMEYFGEDSDEEHEAEFLEEDMYLNSCKERISSWVVKYLMPYYHRKKIIGRKVFKSLGQHVSDSIIQQIQYPDEWTVKYFVSKFFPPDVTFLNDCDVPQFQIV